MAKIEFAIALYKIHCANPQLILGLHFRS